MIPASVVTNILAHAGLITAIKSGWELTRMVRAKLKDSSVRDEAPRLYARLRRARDQCLIEASEYSYWRKELWDAEKHHDRKLRTPSYQTWLIW